MKKLTNGLVVAIVVGIFVVTGCGKQSGLTGEVLDAKKLPVSGLKVIAKQIKPIIKGYEKFETTTGPDGTFTFTKLYPSSDYVVSVWHKDWSTNTETRETTGVQGDTVVLLYPLQIFIAVDNSGYHINPQTNKPRFVESAEGIITDLMFELEWFLGPDIDTAYDEAKAWCAGLSIAGGGWRMPKRPELMTAYVTGLGEKNLKPTFKTTGAFVWSGDKFTSKSDWGLPSSSGERHGGRAFAVRSIE